MLPYSPLHHLLVRDFGGPLVATSGNLSGEPVLTEPEEAERRLDRVADGFLHHDRPILRPADDALYRTTGGRPRPLRLGRGSAPLELELPAPMAHPTLAVGGHLKACIALAWERRLVVSPHIGDMGTLRSQQVFEQLVQDLQALYRVEARRLVCDAHPDYSTHRWARRDGRPLHRVLHHHAHASALAGEAEWDRPGLVFTWDGTGLGEDGTLWGGELFYGLPGAWERVGRLRPFRLPGGDLAGRAPWRSAAALLWETGLDWAGLPSTSELAHQAWRRGLNAPPSSAAGRLFDAAASLCGLVQEASFEGQGPMYLEALVRAPGEPCELPLRRTPVGLWELDWAPLLPRLLEPGVGPQRKAEDFHSSLALALRRQAQQLARERAVERVGLCGGVFQNRVLVDQARAALAEAGFAVDLPLQLPANDAAIAFGQIQEQLARDQSR
jgi:hydrogenase maturation protein HypF